MNKDDSADSLTAEKLPLLVSPLVSKEEEDAKSPPPGDFAAPDLQLFGDRFGANHDCPQFKRHEDASLLELFYDLFFAANYTVFSQTQGVNSWNRFTAYVGYFSMLWATWLLVGLYDVRFVTDSIFERAARGVQLGVMVGFAVVAPEFAPDNQDIRTMRTMSLILCVSRFCLAIEYGSILWHIRKYRKQRLPLYIQIGLNVIAAAIYLGITFRFRHKNSRVFVTWYVMAAAEIILTFLIANIWPVLSFTGTHLMKRLSLLTVVILGDGIIVMAQNVVTIVEGSSDWNSTTIGIVTAATATIYFVFLTYFDWMRHPYLPALRQQLWTIVHYPLHLALVLFMQGFNQFIVWSKIINVIGSLSFESVLNTVDDVSKASTATVVSNLTDLTTDFFERFPPKYYMTYVSVNDSLNNISSLADEFWPKLAHFAETLDDNDRQPQEDFDLFANSFISMTVSMENALLENFKIDLVEEVIEADNTTTSSNVIEINVNVKTWERFELVFSYTYIAVGLLLILMTVLTIISRTTPWRRGSIIRTTFFLLLGVGLSLVATLQTNPLRSFEFRASPWLLPTITIVWVVVLVATHIRDPPPLFFSKKSSKFNKSKTKDDPASTPMNEEGSDYHEAGRSQSQERQRQAYV